MSQAAMSNPEDYWTPFDNSDVSLIVQGLDGIDVETLNPEGRSRLIELRNIFIQRETAYYGS